MSGGLDGDGVLGGLCVSGRIDGCVDFEMKIRGCTNQIEALNIEFNILNFRFDV